MKNSLLTILASFFAFLGCSQMKYSEYSYERIDLTNGSHIMAIHNSNCPCHKGLLKPTSSKYSFIKKKYYIFCSACWEPDEIRQMNYYNKANSIRAIDWDYVTTNKDWEYARLYERVMDTTNRSTYLRYALRDDKLVGFDITKLPNKHRYIIWD